MNYKIGEITFEYQNDSDILSQIKVNDYSKITSVTISTSIKEIGFGAFEYFQELKSITIPTSVTKICRDAFKYCWELETLIIPPTVIEIEDKTFNPVVSLLILPQKFKRYYKQLHIDMFHDTLYKSHTECYFKTRKIFYHGDQNLMDYLNTASENLSQLKSYYPLLNKIVDKSLSENKILSQNRTLLQAYKNVSQKYPILFKEFEKEVLRLDPDFKFE